MEGKNIVVGSPSLVGNLEMVQKDIERELIQVKRAREISKSNPEAVEFLEIINRMRKRRTLIAQCC